MMRKIKFLLFTCVLGIALCFTTSLNAVVIDSVAGHNIEQIIEMYCPKCGNPNLDYYGYYEDETQQVFHVTLIVCPMCGYSKSLL